MKMTREEYFRRDYDMNSIEEDWRLKRCTVEAWITIIVRLILTAALMAVKYTIGAQDPAQYSYLFGLPLWAALSYIFIFIALIVSGVIVKKVFKNFSLEDES